jgi:hypothetical protein
MRGRREGVLVCCIILKSTSMVEVVQTRDYRAVGYKIEMVRRSSDVANTSLSVSDIKDVNETIMKAI